MRTSHPPPLTSSADIDGDGVATDGMVGDNIINNGNQRDFPKRGSVVPPEGIVGATDQSIAEAARQSVPLKVMVFIDGTWLYYSFFGRCVWGEVLRSCVHLRR